MKTRCETHAYILAAHTQMSDGLHAKSVHAFHDALAARQWGRVAVIARLLDLTQAPCIDRHEDVTAICNDYTLRIIALDIIGGVI